MDTIRKDSLNPPIHGPPEPLSPPFGPGVLILACLCAAVPHSLPTSLGVRGCKSSGLLTELEGCGCSA